MLRKKIKPKREGRSTNFTSLARSLAEKLILSKDLKEERKQTMPIPELPICRNPEERPCLLGSVSNKELQVA